MRIMLDTNILISALVFGGKARRLVEKLLVSEHEVWVSKYVADEFSDKLYEKWPDRADSLISILKRLPIHFCGSTEIQKGNLRDAKDIPVLSDALYYQADVILTGDKDFLEAELDKPIIYSLKMLEEFFEGSTSE